MGKDIKLGIVMVIVSIWGAFGAIMVKLQEIHYDVIDIHEAVFTELLIEEGE